ncbi:MAG: helix-turn-helix domain-containing protein [Shewanella sp.]
MQMLRATKIRIYPTQEQAEFLMAQFGSVWLSLAQCGSRTTRRCI